MESRIYVFLLSAMLLAPAVGQAKKKPDKDDSEEASASVIQPRLERREIKPPQIDTEDFEVGPYGGVMSIEDFGSNTVTGLRFNYHITERFFTEAAYAQTKAERTSYEVLSGGAQLLTDEQRDYSYYSVSFGINVFPGEVFIGKRAFGSALYIIAGAGNTEFAGDDHFTLNVGGGARLLITDWLAAHIDVRDHLFDTDLLGEAKTTHNIGLHIGFTGFF